ncbi:MAG: YlxR family protein [Oscillospiraceae bacterium]|jgi:predicted RNA-binding protein YlxR (DUF448 family)|nr:YlxR family protein [Oscillospiraceae bacterium]
MLIRKCVGCGKQKNKFEFIRINRTPKSVSEFRITVVEPKKVKYLDGRSAYICSDISCFKKAKKSRRLEKILSCKISEEIYEKIAEFANLDSQSLLFNADTVK